MLLRSKHRIYSIRHNALYDTSIRQQLTPDNAWRRRMGTMQLGEIGKVLVPVGMRVWRVLPAGSSVRWLAKGNGRRKDLFVDGAMPKDACNPCQTHP